MDEISIQFDKGLGVIIRQDPAGSGNLEAVLIQNFQETHWEELDLDSEEDINVFFAEREFQRIVPA